MWSNPPLCARSMVRNRDASHMSPPPGRLVRACRRACWAHPRSVLTTRELLAWAYPRGLPDDPDKRRNRYRALRRAAENAGLECVGRVWPDGNIWRPKGAEAASATDD
jgi:hypothetical protein